MAAFLHDVLLLEEHALVQVRVEIGLHPGVGHIGRPAHEVVNAFLRTVGIVYLQAIALRDDIVAHGLQCRNCFFGEKCRRGQITVDALAHKVVDAVVTYFQNGVRDYVRDGDKTAAVLGGVFFCAAGSDASSGKDYQDRCYNPNLSCFHRLQF